MRSTALSIGSLTGRTNDEVRLAHAAISGDPEAFAQIYERHRRAVYAFCLSRLMNPAAADDATQEVFLRILKARPGSIDSLKPWLFGVARHVCADVARRHEDHVDLELAGERASADCGDGRAELEHVALAVSRMRPRYRTAFVLSEVQERPVAVVAQALGLTVGATHTLLSRARSAFHDSYREVEELPQACRHAASLHHQQRTNDLDARQEASLRMHLEQCPDCARLARRERRVAHAEVLRSALGIPLIGRLWSNSGAGRAFERLFAVHDPGSVATAATAVVLAASLGAGGAPAPNRADIPPQTTVAAAAPASPATQTITASKNAGAVCTGGDDAGLRYLRQHRHAPAMGTGQSGRRTVRATSPHSAEPGSGRHAGTVGAADGGRREEPQSGAGVTPTATQSKTGLRVGGAGTQKGPGR